VEYSLIARANFEMDANAETELYGAEWQDAFRREIERWELEEVNAAMDAVNAAMDAERRESERRDIEEASGWGHGSECSGCRHCIDRQWEVQIAEEEEEELIRVPNYGGDDVVRTLDFGTAAAVDVAGLQERLLQEVDLPRFRVCGAVGA
jgi:hypothetical protein